MAHTSTVNAVCVSTVHSAESQSKIYIWICHLLSFSAVILLDRGTRQAVLAHLYTDSFLLSSRVSAVQTVEYITASKAT